MGYGIRLLGRILSLASFIAMWGVYIWLIMFLSNAIPLVSIAGILALLGVLVLLIPLAIASVVLLYIVLP